jgi:anthranilate synthase component II
MAARWLLNVSSKTEFTRFMILVIDNYDSFTHNLVQYLGELSAATERPVQGNDRDTIQVYRNDQISLEEIRQLQPQGIVLSPGPGRPEQAGICNDIIRELAGVVPILGVCLGHQCIGINYGAEVVAAPTLMHGKTSPIFHEGIGVFKGLPNPFTATRYHSLVIQRETCPDILRITASTEDGVVMGVQHRDYPSLQGVQFHPESILTTQGKALLMNFLESLSLPQTQPQQLF